MAFVLETHMHTSNSSKCGKLTAIQQVQQYKAAGYDGIVVTDHFVNGNSAVDRSLPWEQQMHDQFAGYREAYEEGERIGLKVFFGTEFGFYGTEFLIYGLSEQWYIEHPEVADMSPDAFIPLMRNAGASIIQAHPYREASYIEEIRLYPELVDALEVYNHLNQPAWNESADKLATSLNKPVTAGSDCHRPGTYGAGIILDDAISTTDELVSLIKSGKGWSIIRGDFNANC